MGGETPIARKEKQFLIINSIKTIDMKKFIYSAMAVAMLATTSCKDDLAESFVGDQATVEFSISTPEIATRAYSDGTTATVLQYAVYDAAGNELTDLTVTNGEIHGSTTVNLQLTTGNTYSVIFWAAAENAPYTVDFGAKTMTVDYTGALSNDENRDAFYKYHTFTVNGAQTETIELKRPFAQLNIGTADYAASKSAGYVPTQSYVKVSDIYTTLNLASGEVDKNTMTSAEFAYAAIPTLETFPVAGNEYIAMNYLLVSASKELVDVDFKYTDGSNEKTRTVGSVPVQRNYRTNIYGNLLTSEVDINVTIEPEYNEPAYTADDLQKAAAFGGKVTLTEDVVLTTPLNVQANMTLNLGGNTLTGAVNVADDVQVTVNNGKIVNTNKEVSGITSNGDLTLNDVEITSARHAIRIESGKAVINGGKYMVDPISKSTLHALNVGDNGTTAEVIIKGGTFIGPKGTMADSGSAVSVRSGSTVEIEGGDFSGGKTKTLSNGGTLTVVGGSFDQDPSAFVADGYKAIAKDGKYYVVPEEADAVATTKADIETALSNGETNVYVVAGEYTMPAGDKFSAGDVITCAEGVVFTGNSKLNINGATVIGAKFSNPGGTAVDQTINGTFKGCTFEGSNGARWAYAGETVVFEDCVFSGSVYGVHFDGGAQDVIFRNCTISGFNALGGALTMVTFEGCTFVGNGKSGYNGANLWGSAKMINCEFTFDGTTSNEWIDCIGADKTYEFENCTVNGAAYTPTNYTSFTKIFSRNNVTVKINGVDCEM